MSRKKKQFGPFLPCPASSCYNCEHHFLFLCALLPGKPSSNPSTPIDPITLPNPLDASDTEYLLMCSLCPGPRRVQSRCIAMRDRPDGVRVDSPRPPRVHTRQSVSTRIRTAISFDHRSWNELGIRTVDGFSCGPLEKNENLDHARTEDIIVSEQMEGLLFPFFPL